MAFLFLLLLHLLQPYCAHAGRVILATPTPPTSSCCGIGFFIPAAAIIFSVLSVLIAVFLAVLFLFYCCRVNNNISRSTTVTVATRAPEPITWGLDKSVIDSFPIMLYSEVKQLAPGRGALECAVCLCEFEDADSLRLLSECNHAFHPNCIDAWLDSHTTCPVCRESLIPANACGTIMVESGGQDAVSTDEETGGRPAAPARSDRFTLRLPARLREELMARGLQGSVRMGHPHMVEAWRVSMGQSGFKIGRKEWAVMSDRYDQWSLQPLETGVGTEGFGRRREGIVMLQGETSRADSFRLE